MELNTYAAPAAGDQHVRMQTTQAQVYATLPVDRGLPRTSDAEHPLLGGRSQRKSSAADGKSLSLRS